MEGKINFSQLCSNTSKVKEAVKSETMEGVRGLSGKVYLSNLCKKTCPKKLEIWENNKIRISIFNSDYMKKGTLLVPGSEYPRDKPS